MKIVFLDIDGVLNSHAWFEENHPNNHHPEGHLSPHHIAELNRVVSVTGAKVVVSSTWRMGWIIGEIQRMLSDKGFQGTLVGMTPVRNRLCRGDEIQEWLDGRNVEAFVIVDDDSDMGSLLDHLVQTNFSTGLNATVADEMIQHLGHQ